MLTEEQFREIALSLPGSIEGAHMGHPDFRAHGRIFASLHGNGETAMVKLSPDEQGVVIVESPRVFVPANGAWGRQGCTTVLLATATERSVRAAMLLAWEGAARAAEARRATKRRTSRAPQRASQRMSQPASGEAPQPSHASVVHPPGKSSGRRTTPARGRRRRPTGT